MRQMGLCQELKTPLEFSNFMCHKRTKKMVTPGSWHIVAEVRRLTYTAVLHLTGRLIPTTTNF